MGKRGPKPQHEDLLKVRLSPELKEKVAKAAASQGLTLSEYVRRVLEHELGITPRSDRITER